MDFKPVLYIQGILLSILSISMIFPMLADMYWQSPDWQVFFFCIVITSFFGGSMILSNLDQDIDLNLRQAFMMIVLSWVTLPLFGSLPFILSNMNLSFTDAIFESVSGMTTTGSTIIVGLDNAPPGILLWRAILQWLGGIGIIIMAMSILPFLNVGGMQIFKTELSEDEKALPRAAKLASSIGFIYVILTFICTMAYLTAGMGKFDALSHAMTTIATGGFANYDKSMAHFNNENIEMIATFFMICAGIPFVLYLKASSGNIRPLFKDTQVRWFLFILISAIIITTTYLVLTYSIQTHTALVSTAFNVTSLMTGTGYTSAQYDQWGGGFIMALLMFLMAMGACAGSTSCGIKIFRFQIFASVVIVQIKKLIYPNAAFVPHYNGKPIPDDVPLSVMSFLFLYAVCFIALALALSMVGLDFITAFSGAMTAISNVGPGMGPIIGPTGNFEPLPDIAKWILTIGMLVGRLEILAAFVIFHPSFWRH